MGDRTLYDEDILVWSEQQAAALRSLASRRDLPNELDLANVIEEIEDVGRSAMLTIGRHVQLVVSWASLDAEPGASGPGVDRSTTRACGIGSRKSGNCERQLRQRITPINAGEIDIDLLWRRRVAPSSIKAGGIGATGPLR